jgi:ABC-type lipoprotein release transport system permease subunit
LSIATSSNVCARTNLIDGKYLSDNPDEVVAEQSFAVAHNLSVGDTLNVFGGRMKVAGIINSGIKPVKADLYAPIGIVRSLLKDKLQCIAPGFDMNIILVEVSDPRLQEDVIKHVENMIYKFSVSTYNCYQPANKVMAVIEKSSIGLTVFIFIFLVLFSAKTQLSVLMERLREIGILKSLGWSDLRLGVNIIISSSIQAFAGVTLGLFLWIILLFILKSQSVGLVENLDIRMLYDSLPLLYGFSLTGGLIAGIFPIMKIRRTKAGDVINNYL